MENGNNKILKEALHALLLAQEHTAPIKLSIGYTDKSQHIQKNCLLIHEAPPAIITMLVKDARLVCYMTEKGLIVSPLP